VLNIKNAQNAKKSLPAMMQETHAGAMILR
jgi:hypothetical protein